jgi:hypothetical protein
VVTRPTRCSLRICSALNGIDPVTTIFMLA